MRTASDFLPRTLVESAASARSRLEDLLRPAMPPWLTLCMRRIAPRCRHSKKSCFFAHLTWFCCEMSRCAKTSAPKIAFGHNKKQIKLVPAVLEQFKYSIIHIHAEFKKPLYLFSCRSKRSSTPARINSSFKCYSHRKIFVTRKFTNYIKCH